jgi:3-oxoacyl-[acyl-carrier protein] reductase
LAIWQRNDLCQSQIQDNMNKQLENKVAIITGASKGIGAGIARQVAAAGARVVVNYASDQNGAEALVAAIAKAGGTAIAIQADISRQADVQRLFEETMQAYGQLDILVNNAGVYEFALLDQFTEESYRRIFDINVLGLLLASQGALNAFGVKGGSIINIGSFASTRPEPYSIVYGASKGAVDTITRALSQELGPKGIRVNAIQPGGVLTEGTSRLGAVEDSDMIKQMVSRSALGRMATPEDIGNAVVFLAADESEIITGQFIEVSGGLK